MNEWMNESLTHSLTQSINHSINQLSKYNIYVRKAPGLSVLSWVSVIV